MKSRFTVILSLLFLVLAFLPNFLAAGEQEVIDVPPTYEGSQLGVLNRFIMGDTINGGERAHPNCIYRLERGQYYQINKPMRIDFTLTLDALPDDPDSPTRPPMIIMGKDEDGAYISRGMNIMGDSVNVTFRNVFFNGIYAGEDLETHAGYFSFMEGSYHRITIDNCIIQGFSGNFIADRASDHGSYFVTNVKFYNNFDIHGVGGGAIVSNTVKGSTSDSIIYVNNTFFNSGGNMILNWTFTNYFEFSHNTVYNTPINGLWIPYITNGKWNNNLFVDYQTVGETEWELVNGHWDKGLVHGRASILKLNLLDSATVVDHGISEADRNVEAFNNVYSWSEGIKDFWDNTVSQKDIDMGYTGEVWPTLWINSITDSMFADSVNYPDLTLKDNAELDPGFDATMVSEVLAKEIPFITEYRKYGWSNLTDATERFYNPGGVDNALFDVPWPLPFDLSYTNTDVMKHAEGNFPAGDLNWYPELKKLWEEGGVVGVDEQAGNGASLREYKLSQNYPNPFNPTTEMSFTIPVSGKTTLAVYNVLGQKVATLVNKNLNAGSYKYQFDASNFASGIYFYKLQANDFVQVKKMMLIK